MDQCILWKRRKLVPTNENAFTVVFFKFQLLTLAHICVHPGFFCDVRVLIFFCVMVFVLLVFVLCLVFVLLFVVLCLVFVVLFVVLCLVFVVASVSGMVSILGCPLTVFSNIYFKM
jgi:hypothetical protein